MNALFSLLIKRPQNAPMQVFQVTKKKNMTQMTFAGENNAKLLRRASMREERLSLILFRTFNSLFNSTMNNNCLHIITAREEKFPFLSPFMLTESPLNAQKSFCNRRNDITGRMLTSLKGILNKIKIIKVRRRNYANLSLKSFRLFIYGKAFCSAWYEETVDIRPNSICF